MAEMSTIARPYAKAIFKLAQESNAVFKWDDFLKSLAMATNMPTVSGILADRRITKEQKKDLLVTALKKLKSAELDRLVAILIQNNRLNAIPEILLQFEQLKKIKEGRVMAEIETAYPLSAVEEKNWVRVLEQKWGKNIEPTYKVVPELIGGIRVTIGDVVLDQTVRAKLDRMSVILKQ
jgi:F-type H+-transporting ATPase subunit delta